MCFIRFFLSTFKGNYEDYRGEIGRWNPAHQGLFLFHLRQQVDEVIQIPVEVQE